MSNSQAEWRAHRDTKHHAAVLNNSVKGVDMARVKAADINLAETFDIGEQRKQNLNLHLTSRLSNVLNKEKSISAQSKDFMPRSSLLNASSGETTFKPQLNIEARVSVLKAVAKKVNSDTVRAALSIVDKRTNQSFFKQTMPVAGDKQFNGLMRKENIRNANEPGFNLDASIGGANKHASLKH